MKKVVVATLVVAGMSLAVAHSLVAAPRLPRSHTPDAIQGWCNEQGGSYWWYATGVWGCSLPDGTLVACTQAQGCITIPPPRTTPTGGLKDLLAGQKELLAKMDEVADNQSRLGASLSRAEQSILDGQLAIATEMSGLQLQCTLPDLVPLPVGALGFSRCDSEGKLHVFVDNQGGGAAAASQTQVYFRVPVGLEGPISCGAGCAQVNADTPQLPGFAGTDLTFAIPAGCYDIDLICQFKIQVDGASQVIESSESNDSAAGQCVGTIR